MAEQAVLDLERRREVTFEEALALVPKYISWTSHGKHYKIPQSIREAMAKHMMKKDVTHFKNEYPVESWLLSQ
jgi:hypothetical protein